MSQGSPGKPRAGPATFLQNVKIISYRSAQLSKGRDNLYKLFAGDCLLSRVSLPHVAGMMILAEAESRCFHLLLSAPFCPPILKPHLKHKTVGARFIYRRRGLKRFNSTFNPVKTSKMSIKTNVAGAGAWLHLLVHATFNLENHAFRIV